MTQPIVLEPPSEAYADEFLRLVAESQELHSPWISPPFTDAAYVAYLQRCEAETFRGFFVCDRSTGELAGVINLSEIVRGCFQSAYLGFYAFAPRARRGYLRAGVAEALTTAFGELALHRVEANVQPDNLPSRTLIESVGFRREGYSPKYLKIDGEWKDHERWALLAEDWRRRE